MCQALGRQVARRARDRRRAHRRDGVKVLVAGIIARYPFGGVTWCSLMYLLGLRDLGHDVFYIEDTGECIYEGAGSCPSRDPLRPARWRERRPSLLVTSG